MPENFDELQQKYAELLVHVGLNMRAGQRLMISSPIVAAPLVRRVAACAYQAGVRLVDVAWDDEELTLIRYQHAPRDSFEEYAPWRVRALEELLQDDGAYLSLRADNPKLLKDQDPALVQTAAVTARKHSQKVSELIGRSIGTWCVASMPSPSWAEAIFPELPVEEQVPALWEAIFETLRLKTSDPVAVWKEHARQLGERCKYMTAKAYQAIQLDGPGTDLSVGLVPGHVWMGGQNTTQQGWPFMANLPTEEVFTMPHRARVEGVVTATKPLSYSGSLVHDFRLTFKEGQVVDFSAAEGEETLRRLLDTDEGARRLGELALVPHSAPTSQVGIMFFNTLFDENAASHLALGRAYTFNLKGGSDLTPEDLLAAGSNNSLVHVDFMVGSGQVDVDGVLPDGSREPLMRNGEWVFEV